MCPGASEAVGADVLEGLDAAQRGRVKPSEPGGVDVLALDDEGHELLVAEAAHPALLQARLVLDEVELLEEDVRLDRARAVVHEVLDLSDDHHGSHSCCDVDDGALQWSAPSLPV